MYLLLLVLLNLHVLREKQADTLLILKSWIMRGGWVGGLLRGGFYGYVCILISASSAVYADICTSK